MNYACVIDVQKDVAAFVNNLHDVKVLGRSADLGECSGPRRPCLLSEHRCCCCGHVFSCELKLGWGGWTRTIISRVRVGFPTIERHPNRKLKCYENGVALVVDKPDDRPLRVYDLNQIKL